MILIEAEASVRIIFLKNSSDLSSENNIVWVNIDLAK